MDLQNIDLKPLSEVGNNLINKVSHAIGYCVTPKGTKLAQLEAHKSIIDEIANKHDINPIERAAIISNYKKIIKQYANQNDIVNIAIDHLDDNANPEIIEDDWLDLFFEKSKNISNEQMKIIWGRILAEQCNMPSSISKSLLNVLSIMEYDVANAFNILSQHVITTLNGHPIPIIPYNDRRNYCVAIGLDRDMLIDLQNYNLITIDFFGGYQWKEKILKSNYFDTNIEVESFENEEVHVGEVLLTRDGIRLWRVIPHTESPKLLQLCKTLWEKRNYKIDFSNH